VGNASRNKTNDTNCIFVESVGFYTQEMDQGNLTFGSALFGGRIGSRILTENIWRKMLKQTIFDISQERDNLFASVTTFLTEGDKPKRGIFDTQLLSIKG